MTTLREAAQMALDAFEDRYTTPEGRAAIEALRAALAKEQENSRSQKMIDAGFTKRDTLLECDGCGKKFSRLMLPIHVCENAQPEPVLVSPKEFISAVTGKWDIQGIPMLMSVWPVSEEAQPEQYTTDAMKVRQAVSKAVLEQSKQEPIAYLCENAVGHKYFRWKKPPSTYKPIALYTAHASPQRIWQGMTDEEQMQVAWSCGAMSADWLDFARAIEARLREKNSL